MIDLDDVVSAYNKGWITESELVHRLSQAAADYSPEGIAPLIPDGILAKICENSVDPPISQVDAPRTATIDGDNSDHRVCEDQRRLFEGLRRWHAYFDSIGRPPDGLHRAPPAT